MASNYSKNLYDDYEKAQLKLDAILLELFNIKKEHRKELNTLKKSLLSEFKKEKEDLNETIKSLSKQLEDANKLIEKLKNDNDRLKNQNNKNSSNSSKPSSTDSFKPKRTGANLYNYRIKTNRKPGGQFGHKGSYLSKMKVEKLIKENKIEIRTFEHIIKGSSKKENTIKYKIGIDIKPYVEKHIFKYDENVNETLPQEFYTDVTYNNSIKALSIELGAYNVISYDRLSDFFNVITNGVLNISNGTLVNFLCEFSNKTKLTIEILTNSLLNSKNINTDETNTKFNGNNMYVRNYSTDDIVVYKVHLKKGHKPIIEDNILPRFCGGIMADHDTTIYSYTEKRYECNVHLGRYLEELIQNINDITWAKQMKEFIFELNNKRKSMISKGIKSFSIEEITDFYNRYDEIISIGMKENQLIKSSYYKGKADSLLRRLRKYKENHLYFIKDFDVRFDNNISESDLRMFKIKTKISGGFRSINSAEDYMNTLSIIKTSIKRNINPFESIKAIFNNQILFQS